MLYRYSNIEAGFCFIYNFVAKGVYRVVYPHGGTGHDAAAETVIWKRERSDLVIAQ
jgi:hypothetical protein